MRYLLLSLLALTPLSAASAEQTRILPKQAAIDGAANGSIRDWHADNPSGIYLRDRTNRWYYAAFTHPCPGVVYEQAVHFNTFGDTRFDRSSQVVTRVGSCAIASLVETTAPAAKGGKRKTAN